VFGPVATGSNRSHGPSRCTVSCDHAWTIVARARSNASEVRAERVLGADGQGAPISAAADRRGSREHVVDRAA
jgi:hypothetical protein